MKIKNNYGYTLTELLLTIAIFSIVMVSIFALVRSSSVTYKNENSDVLLQEEAQIIVNQIEEYLVDCNQKVEKKGNGYYCVQSKDSSGQHYYYFKLNNDNCIYFAESSAPISDDTAVNQLMAEYVKSFSIDGLDFADTSTGDNACIVNIEMKNNTTPDIVVNNPDGTTSTVEGNGYNYQTSKKVYFRNNIENLTDHIISGSTNGGGTSNNDVEIDIKRYQLKDVSSLGLPIDLTSSDLGLTLTQDESKYTFYYAEKDSNDNIKTTTMSNKGDSLNLNSTQLEKIKNHEADVYITTASSLLSIPYSTSYSDSVPKGDCYISSGASKVYLTTKPVSFDNGTGIYMIPNMKFDNGADIESIILNGFDLGAYEKYWGGAAPQVKAQFYKDANSNKKFDNGEQNGMGEHPLGLNNLGGLDAQTAKINLINYNSTGGFAFDETNSKVTLWGKFVYVFGCLADGDIYFSCQNNIASELDPQDMSSKASYFSNGDVRMYFAITLPDNTYYVDYMVGVAGMTIPDKTFGPNVYN